MVVIELLNIDDVIKGYKDIPYRYYDKFFLRFDFFHVGTTQALLATKESVRRWFDSFSTERKATFRDAGYIQSLLDKPSVYTVNLNNYLVDQGRRLHGPTKEPFENVIRLIGYNSLFREELIEENRKLHEELQVSTETESVEINNRIADINSYLERVNSVLNTSKLAPYYKGMLLDEDASDVFDALGADIACF